MKKGSLGFSSFQSILKRCLPSLLLLLNNRFLLLIAILAALMLNIHTIVIFANVVILRWFARRTENWKSIFGNLNSASPFRWIGRSLKLLTRYSYSKVRCWGCINVSFQLYWASFNLELIHTLYRFLCLVCCHHRKCLIPTHWMTGIWQILCRLWGE